LIKSAFLIFFLFFFLLSLSITFDVFIKKNNHAKY